MHTVIREAISAALHELKLSSVDFSVEHPKELAHGDYASNVAMVVAKGVAKETGKAPREVAEQLLAVLEGKIEYVEHIEVAGPGFINFHLSRDFFQKEIKHIGILADDWGKNEGERGEEVLVEYTSPNLFKPLHVGNLVGNIVGEALTRLYEYSGAKVYRLNYPSDIGLTVAKGVWGLQKTGGDPSDISALGEAYRVGNAAYESEGEEKEAIITVNKALYTDSDPELSKLREQGLATSKKHLHALLDVLGTTFDYEIFESEAGPLGTEIVKEHTNIFEESEGAVVYRGEKVGLHTRVFLNSEGLPTYEAKDLGNFVLKQKEYPNWTQSVVVTGNEQAEYFKVIIAAIKEVFVEARDKSMEHVSTGFLTLSTGKMSSRKGNVLTGESLIDELWEEADKRAGDTRSDDPELGEQIAVAALKYQILRHSVGSNIVFDKERALSFEGDSGPYLQYTHARIGSVEEKAEKEGVSASLQHVPETPYEIEKILYRFPEVVEQALLERSPHYVTTFLTELAGAFNTFYAQEKIADAGDEYAPYKLALAGAVKQTLKNGLWVLGIKAPERM